jgi:hypothetical protein
MSAPEEWQSVRMGHLLITLLANLKAVLTILQFPFAQKGPKSDVDMRLLAQAPWYRANENNL